MIYAEGIDVIVNNTRRENLEMLTKANPFSCNYLVVMDLELFVPEEYDLVCFGIDSNSDFEY